MRHSESRRRFSLVPRRAASARLELFDRPGRPLKIVPANTKPIWRKETNVARWPFVLAFSLVFALSLVALAQAEGPPRGRGARPIALGSAYTAVSGDAYSLFYNPAGLFDLKQSEFALDMGRFYTPLSGSGADFNGTYAMPYRFRDMAMPIAFGVYGEGPVEGAPIVDVMGGAAMDAPVDRWTKGFIKKPVRLGGALTIRHQAGEEKTDRVGKSSLGLGLTGGLLMPVDRKHQIGFAVRNLYAGDAEPKGASMHIGAMRHHNEYLDVFAELEYGKGGTWRFHPGLEWLFARGVIRPRLGWGFRESQGIDTVATGVGVYVSPMQIDFSYLIPIKTLNDNAGQFRASLVYRFGRPQFSEIYFDRALEAASQLDHNVLTLTVKEAELKASLAEIEQKRKLAAEELANAKRRIEALKDQDLLGERDAMIRDLRARIRELEGQVSGYRSRAAAVSREKPKRYHTVVAGETLQSIAREYYSDPNQWKKIYGANNDKIDRGLPRAGSKLLIP